MNRNIFIPFFRNPVLMAGIFLISGFGSPHESTAQIIYRDPARIDQSFVFLNWNLKGDTTDVSISQWVFPVSGMVPLGDNAELRYYTALSGAESSSEAFSRDLSGLTDTRIQLAHTLVGNQILVAGGINFPTGQTKLAKDQFELLRVLSAEKFNFPVKTYGEALGVYGEVLGATEAGRWTVGGGVGAYYSGEYEPTDDGISYRHGLRTYLTGSAETTAGETTVDRLKFDIMLVVAMADQANEQDVFQDGILFDIAATGTHRLGHWNGLAQARAILRGKDRRLSQTGNLAAESYASTGSELRLSAQASRQLGDRWVGTLGLASKFLMSNNYPETDLLHDGGATLIGIGGRLGAQFTAQTGATIGLRKWFGSAAAGGTTEALDLSGWEISQQISVIF